MKNIFIISGKALKEARKAVPALTQAMVAKEIGMSREAYTNWEGKEAIETDRKTVEKLKTLLNVSEDVITHVPHETKDGKLADLYMKLADERLERIEELKEQVQTLKNELADCRSRKKS